MNIQLNMISINEYADSMLSDLLSYCKMEYSIKDSASVNMWDNSWHDKPNTLPYILSYSDRFTSPNGKFYLLRDSDKIIGCAGVYKSSFSEKVAFLGVRSWVSKEYRMRQLVRNYLLPAQRDWAIEHGAEVVALSFNHYNKNLIKMFTKGQVLLTRTEKHMFYKNFNALKYPVYVQGILQWIIFENLSDYQFDWASISK